MRSGAADFVGDGEYVFVEVVWLQFTNEHSEFEPAAADRCLSRSILLQQVMCKALPHHHLRSRTKYDKTRRDLLRSIGVSIACITGITLSFYSTKPFVARYVLWRFCPFIRPSIGPSHAPICVKPAKHIANFSSHFSPVIIGFS